MFQWLFGQGHGGRVQYGRGLWAASGLALTYAVEALQGTLSDTGGWLAWLDLLALSRFAAALFVLAVRVLTAQLD